MNGHLRQDIISKFKKQFEEDCIKLLLESYHALITSTMSLDEVSENAITARLVGYMKINSKRQELQISVDRESYLDGDEIYEGLLDPNKSLRIDIKFTTWNSKVEHFYHIEAKNLAESNFIKPSTNTLVNAESLRKRYVEVGMGNFISGKYPKGCLVAYVIQGAPGSIVAKLNVILKSENRSNEILVMTEDYGTTTNCFHSHHVSLEPESLKHFFLQFINSNEPDN